MSGTHGTGYDAVDVAIVGGGIIGCAIAYELARKGVSAAVIERGEIGKEASWASAGLLHPPTSSVSPARVEMTRRGLQGFPWLVATVQDETGIDVGYRQWGELAIALDESEVTRLRDLAAWHDSQGFDAEWLDADAAYALEPALPRGVLGGVFWKQGASMIVHRLTRALAEAAALTGTAILEQTPALGVVVERGRASGVRVPGAVVPAGTVILAAGAWTSRFGLELGQPLPVAPVKGQMLAIVGGPRAPRHIIAGPGGHLTLRSDGTIAVGATVEHVGFDKRVTPAGLGQLAQRVAVMGPQLVENEVVATWAGLRPATPDGEPLIGPVPGYERLWVASGHFRVGVQLALGTAELVVDGILTGTPDPLLAPLSPARFAADTR